MLGAQMTAEERREAIQRSIRRRAFVGGSIGAALGVATVAALFAWWVVLPTIGLLWTVGWL